MSIIDDFLTEHGITAEVGPSMRYDQHGTAYTEVVIREPQPDAETGFAQYKKALLEFLGANRHIIWRIEPECDVRDNNGRAEYRYYSRLTAYPERLQ